MQSQKFQVIPPRGAPRIVEGAAAAVMQGARHVFLADRHTLPFVRDLQDGKPVRWAYGFVEVWIEPLSH